MILIAGIILGIMIICLIAYFKFPSIKEKIKANKGKVLATTIAASTVAGGLVGIGDIGEIINITVDAELIDDYSIYEKYGYELEKIDNPVIYESEVLTEGHLPLVLKITNDKDIYINSTKSLLDIRETMNKGFKNIKYEFRILMDYENIYEKPIYTYETYLDENGTEQAKKVLSYETIKETRYKFVKIKSLTSIMFKKLDNIIVDISGKFEAGLGNKRIDIIPKISLNDYNKEFPQYAWWNSNWGYRKLITLNRTQIMGTLTNFPVLINISYDSDLSSHAQIDGDDIAFVDYNDNTTKFNHEIEYYDGLTGRLVAWVNDTNMNTYKMWMYYGNATVGSQENVAGTWNSDFIVVYHMNNTDNRLSDATSNVNDATEDLTDPPDVGDYQQDSNIIYSVRPDGAATADDSETWDLPTNLLTNEQWENGFTAELMFNLRTSDESEYDILELRENQDTGVKIRRDDAGYLRTCFQTWDDGASVGRIYGLKPNVETWYYFSCKFDGSTKKLWDSTSNTSVELSLGSPSGGNDLGGTSTDRWGMEDGGIEEVRISKVCRSHDWIVTTYNTQFNATLGAPNCFFTLGAEEAESADGASVYQLNNVSSPYNITWSGHEGEDVWCNSSGDKYEFPEIFMSVNSSETVTTIKIFIDDLNDTDADIGATNITLYVSSDNSSFGSMGAFADGGSNITINTTTWNAGTMGADPFGVGGISNKNVSVYFRLKLAIPSGYSDDTYCSISKTAWKIYICNIT